MIQPPQITSIIDNCSIAIAFSRIINNFDPNRGKNRKTKILDTSTFYVWTENDIKLFDVTKTRNLTGNTLKFRYDIIIYETVNNKSVFADLLEKTKIFTNILNIGGIVIVRAKDFKEDNKLKGNYDIQKIYESNDFYLSDQIIFKNNNNYNNNKSDIVHQYFMLFKKNNPN